jgi:hypothetical protein
VFDVDDLGGEPLMGDPTIGGRLSAGRRRWWRVAAAGALPGRRWIATGWLGTGR